MARGTHTGTAGKNNKPIIKIASMTIAGILIASIVATLSLSSTNGNLSQASNTMDVDLHNQSIVIHNHVQLEVILDGKKASVPENIGINPRLYNDHSLDSFGGSNPPMAPMAPIHTHDVDGVIHIESTQFHDYTMADFLNIWGINLDYFKRISMIVDGNAVPDYKNHILRDGEHITLDFST